jgi:hypothetical protein
MFYFYKKGSETLQCEVRAAANGPGFEIVILESDGAERFEWFATSDEAHSRWLEIHNRFEREGWWGPSTQDGRG